MEFRKLKEKSLQIIREDDFLIMLGAILISFLNAWDFLDRVLGEPIVNTNNDWSVLKLTRPLLTLIDGLLNHGYWSLFIIHILFMVSFYYVGKKNGLKSIWIFILLLTLPIVRYGVWDYGTNPIERIVFIIMIWTYYFGKQKRDWKYYSLSIIGFFTREFCLYVNLFFIIDDFVKGIDFKNLKLLVQQVLQRFKSTSRKYIFEISLIIIFYLARTIYFHIVDFIPTTAGMLSPGTLYLLLTHYKLWIDFIFIYGILWVILLLKPSVNIYLFLVVIFIPSFLFGIIWEINKMGSVFMIIAYELLNIDKCKKEEQKIAKIEQSPIN